MRREEFLQVLEENNRDIVWTVLGEKQILPPDFGRDYTAWLEVTGVYRIRNGRLEGKIWTEVKEPSDQEEKELSPPEEEASVEAEPTD